MEAVAKRTPRVELTLQALDVHQEAAGEEAPCQDVSATADIIV